MLMSSNTIISNDNGLITDITTHREVHPSLILGSLASCIPFPSQSIAEKYISSSNGKTSHWYSYDKF